jgi:GDP-4-dehydro-6-deoxy-D-mannose reductase
MRALITGVAGFAGSHLAEELLRSRYQVYGTKLRGESKEKLRGFIKSLSVRDLDLRHLPSVRRLVRRVKPDVVFHLAAVSSVGLSFKTPQMTFEVNLLGTVNLLEALREIEAVSKVVVVTSSDVYGVISPSDLPLKESSPMAPVTPYGVSKAAVDMVGYQYFKSYGMPIVRIRAFNHTGPRQDRGFVVPDFCRQVALIESGKSRPLISVGNLKAERDISDVRDIVRGYRLLAEKGRDGYAYHLCSGKSYRIEDILNRILEISTDAIEIKPDPRLMRPSEIPRLLGDFSRARRAAGYKPTYELKDTLEDTLDYWRTAVRRSEV